MKESSKSIDQLSGQAAELFRQYRVVLFLVLLVIVYGYLLLKINDFNSVAPSVDLNSSPSQPTPNIDKSAVSRLKQLQDNSVNVQALFNQARQNPFN